MTDAIFETNSPAEAAAALRAANIGGSFALSALAEIFEADPAVSHVFTCRLVERRGVQLRFLARIADAAFACHEDDGTAGPCLPMEEHHPASPDPATAAWSLRFGWGRSALYVEWRRVRSGDGWRIIAARGEVPEEEWGDHPRRLALAATAMRLFLEPLPDQPPSEPLWTTPGYVVTDETRRWPCGCTMRCRGDLLDHEPCAAHTPVVLPLGEPAVTYPEAGVVRL